MNIERYTGTWRSYKTFFARGHVKHHEVTCYSEVVLSADGTLTLRSFSTFSKYSEFNKEDWEVCADGKRLFLYLKKKKAFEIITLETAELVLQDTVTAEKIFFASLPLWQERLQPQKERNDNVYITLWSKSLIKLVKLDD